MPPLTRFISARRYLNAAAPEGDRPSSRPLWRALWIGAAALAVLLGLAATVAIILIGALLWLVSVLILLVGLAVICASAAMQQRTSSDKD